MVMWVVFTAWLRYDHVLCSKSKSTPEISVAYESDWHFRDQNEKQASTRAIPFGIGHILVLRNTGRYRCLGHLWGVMAKALLVGMPKSQTQFFHHGIVAGVIGVIFHLNDMKVNDIAVSFKDGAKDPIGVALVVVDGTGHHAGARGSDPTTPTVITIMYGIHRPCRSSGSRSRADVRVPVGLPFRRVRPGQAAITMPIMAPLADLLGVSRQTSCPCVPSSVRCTKPDRPDLRLPDRSPGDCKKIEWSKLDQIHVEILRDTDDRSNHYGF